MAKSKSEYYYKLIEFRLSRNLEQFEGVLDANLLKTFEKKNLDDIKRLHEFALLEDDDDQTHNQFMEEFSS